MDIETYAEKHPQLATDEVEPHLLSWLTRSTFTTLLDVGCGSGRLVAALMSRHLLDDAQVRGVDLSQTNVDRLRARIPEIEVAVDDAETLATVPDDSVDFLVSTQVLEHVDDARMLAAVARVLAPDGIAYISTVFKRPWARFIWRNELGEWMLDPTHVREYTDDAQLLGHVVHAGLALIDSVKVQVAFPAVDFAARRVPGDSERILATRVGRLTRRLRVPIPGYFTWSLVLKPA